MSDIAPTVAHCVSLPAPRGGRCACGPAKPVPRPLLEKTAPTVKHYVSLPASRGGRCVCGPAKLVLRLLVKRIAPALCTLCGSNPLEGIAAPAVRQSRFCGPGLKIKPPLLLTRCDSLPVKIKQERK